MTDHKRLVLKIIGVLWFASAIGIGVLAWGELVGHEQIWFSGFGGLGMLVSLSVITFGLAMERGKIIFWGFVALFASLAIFLSTFIPLLFLTE